MPDSPQDTSNQDKVTEPRPNRNGSRSVSDHSDDLDAPRSLTRRALLQGGAALVPAGGAVMSAACRGTDFDDEPTSRPAAVPAPSGPSVVVVGAGAFGGWTALHLLRKGATVTLVDGWGPGNSRASSGGETRVIRHTYGPDRIYVDWVVRSLELWREEGARWGRSLYRQTGILWMVQEDDEYERAALTHLAQAGIEHEQLSPAGVAERYPQINAEGIEWAIWEKSAGYLLARRACEAVVDGFLAGGGDYRQVGAESVSIRAGGPVLYLWDGSQFEPDHAVFACGPWMGRMFPELLGDLIRPTRQEVFYFGTPDGDTTHGEGELPIWADHGERFWYGIPGSERRGFKVADDTRGPDFDPTTAERQPSPEQLQRARDYMGTRFPGMAGAPLLESRVCQYSNTADGHFIIDRHPESARLWLVGGGSGHGFKHGPALGEYVAELVLGERQPDPFFGLARLGAP